MRGGARRKELSDRFGFVTSISKGTSEPKLGELRCVSAESGPHWRPPERVASISRAKPMERNISFPEWEACKRRDPVAYTPYGSMGKRAVEAVCALHRNADFERMRQRALATIKGQTVDESVSHLVTDQATHSDTGTLVNIALDS